MEPKFRSFWVNFSTPIDASTVVLRFPHSRPIVLLNTAPFTRGPTPKPLCVCVMSCRYSLAYVLLSLSLLVVNTCSTRKSVVPVHFTVQSLNVPRFYSCFTETINSCLGSTRVLTDLLFTVLLFRPWGHLPGREANSRLHGIFYLRHINTYSLS